MCFCTKSLKPSWYVEFLAQLKLDWPHFQHSAGTAARGTERDQSGYCLCPDTVYTPGWETDNKEVLSFQSVSIIEKVMHPHYRDREADVGWLGSQESLCKAEIPLKRHSPSIIYCHNNAVEQTISKFRGST